MITSRLGGSGTVVVAVTARATAIALLSVHDQSGRRVTRRRLHDPRTSLTLPAGRYRLSVEDARPLHDPRRLATASVDVEVTARGTVETSPALTRGAVLRVASAPHARVAAMHQDGERLETRADGRGRVVLAGLRAGTWTLDALDARRTRCSNPAAVTLTPGDDRAVDLDLTTVTSGLSVRVRGGDRRPLRATEVTLVDVTGRRVTAPLRGGLADLTSLRPGPHRLEIPPSLGHLGGHVAVAALEPGGLTSLEVVVTVGATLTGRVVQGAQQYAAVVSLLGPDGVEIERVRTDRHGRFELGTGLRTTTGLTVVATSGPETLHVTRAALAEVDAITGVRHHLDDLVLPVAGPRARWTALRPAVTGPATRV